MINALVFDVDGVLVEYKVFASVLERKYGISREMTAPFFHGPFEDCVLGQADLSEALPDYLVKWNWPGSLEKFIHTWFEADSRINEQMLHFIRAMRAGGRRCYIASTQERQRVAYLERLPAFTGLFEAASSHTSWAVKSRRGGFSTGSSLRLMRLLMSYYYWMIMSRMW